MTLIFNSLIVNPNETIVFTKTNQTYKIVCASVDSNPDVNLTLFDTYSFTQLATSSNSFIKNSCNSSLCTNILQVNIQFTKNIFDNMKSITCVANSSNPLVNLTSAITRNTLVLKPGKINRL